MNKTLKEELKKIVKGEGDSFIYSLKPDGKGGFNFLLEDDDGQPLLATSNLHSKKQCELALASYLLIKNGLEPTFFVHQNKVEPKMNIRIVNDEGQVTQRSVKKALGLDILSTQGEK